MQNVETTPIPATNPPVSSPAPPSVPSPGPATVPTGGQAWEEARRERRRERMTEYRDAGIPIWGILLIAVGAVALLGNFGLDFGWLFGLALGAWFLYLGLRHYPQTQQINWWLVGLGLLIGLGSISSGFLDKLIFPIVLIVVGLGIIAQQGYFRTRR